jgi:hypothetical protein
VLAKLFARSYVFRMPVVTAEQFDLITDDPRREGYQGLLAELREFHAATQELGGLLTQGQAAKILNVSASQVGVWTSRGRLRSRCVAGVRMVAAGEVTALLRERMAGVVHPVGRGHKAPSLADVAKAAWADVFEVE